MFFFWGGSQLAIIDWDNPDPTTSDTCVFLYPHSGRTALCPSYTNCYRYGTYFLKLIAYEPDVLVSIKVSALPIEDVPLRTTSPPDAPAVFYPDPLFPFHVPLFWSVPFTYTYPSFSPYIPLMLSTDYCGFVTIQAQLDTHYLPYEELSIFVSTDPANPFPGMPTTDLGFFGLPLQSLYICPPTGSTEPARIFFLAARNHGFTDTNATFTITVDYERPGLIPFVPPQQAGQLGSWSNQVAFPSSHWYMAGSGSLKLTCPTLSAPLECANGCELFGCCKSVWPSYPTAPSLQPLWPVPYSMRFRNEGTLFTDFNYDPSQLNPRFLGINLLLEANFAGSVQYGPLGPNWASLIQDCTVSRGHAGIGTADGRWIDGSYSFNYVEKEQCDYNAFKEISQDMDKIFKLFVEPDPEDLGVNRPLSHRFRADVLTILDQWQYCQDYVKTALLETSLLDIVATNTKRCPVYSDTDPCCNSNLAWTSCCSPRTIEFQTSFESNITDSIGEECPLTDCTLPVLQSYISGTLLETRGECEPAALLSISQITNIAITQFLNCFDQYLGGEFTGIQCLKDSDCPEIDGSRCDHISHICLGNRSFIEYSFLSCLSESLSAPTRLSMIALNDWEETAKTVPLSQLMMDRYSNTFCVPAFYPIEGSTWRPYFDTSTTYPGCPKGDWLTLSKSSRPPPWSGANQLVGSSCAWEHAYHGPSVDEAICLSADLQCNWDESITDAVSCTNPSTFVGGTETAFCGLCETPLFCEVIPSIDSQATCDQLGRVCRLANGQVLTGLTEAQCAAQLSCTDTCNGAPCTSQSACVTQGECIDTEQIYYLLENTYWATGHSKAGICTFPMPSYDNPDCTLLYPGSFPSSFGCLRFGVCTTVALQLVCTVDFDSKTSCESAMGRWFPRPTTKAECEDPISCDVPRYSGVRTAIWDSNYIFQSDMPSDDCEACGGVIKPVNKWIPQQWLPGTMMTPAWTQRQMVSPYTYTRALDINAISTVLVKSAEQSTNFQTLNTLQCSYGNQKVQIERLACNCIYNLPRSTCFQEDTITSIGQGVLCPFSENRIVSPPFEIESTNSSLSSDLTTACVAFDLNKILSKVFDPPPVVSVTIAFKKRAKAAVQGTYETVYNSKEAVVGSVIGDGLQIVFSDKQSASYVKEFYLCVSLSSYIPYNLSKYPVYDFGWVEFHNDLVAVRPLNVDANLQPSANQLCGLISLKGGVTQQYAPIVRLQDAEAVDGVAFTSGQLACLYCVAALFCIAAGVWFIFVVQMALERVIKVRLPSNVVWVCSICLFTIRAIYLYLVPAGVLNQPNSHQLADFFMMDFPMCLYMILNFQIGLSLLFLYFYPEREDLSRFWVAFFIGAFFIIMLFISILLAYRFEVLNQPGISGPLLCPIYHDSTGSARALRLIYQSIVLGVSVIIGISELLLGSLVFNKVKDIAGAHRILLLGVIASIGIVSDSIAFLVYYIVADPHPYFSIVLIFTEIIPILFLLYQLQVTAVNRAVFTSSHSPGSMKGTGSHTTANRTDD
ncbi:MAG: hypothetical protein ACAH17_02305 [Candidatus Paceibacterota bacterium]